MKNVFESFLFLPQKRYIKGTRKILGKRDKSQSWRENVINIEKYYFCRYFSQYYLKVASNNFQTIR